MLRSYQTRFNRGGVAGAQEMFQGKRGFEAWGGVRFFSPDHSPSFRNSSPLQRRIGAPATQPLTVWGTMDRIMGESLLLILHCQFESKGI